MQSKAFKSWAAAVKTRKRPSEPLKKRVKGASSSGAGARSGALVLPNVCCIALPPILRPPAYCACCTCIA